jgi:hypothetical protein
MKLDAILVDQAEQREAVRQVRTGDLDLARVSWLSAPNADPADHSAIGGCAAPAGR